MKIIYQGTDIYPDVSVNSCIHEMYAASQSDQLMIKFNDTRKLWDRWSPVAGQTIVVQDGTASTGKMLVNSIAPENGLMTLTALACPATGFDKVNKAWEEVMLHQIISEIASKNGLSSEFYGMENPKYQYIQQEMQSDFAFLNERLALESCAFLVFDGKLVAYSEPYMEAATATRTLSIALDTDFEYFDNSGSEYKAAEIECGIYTGTFGGGNGNRILRKTLTTQVGSGPEANRFAQGLLRNANKNVHTGYIWQDFMPDLAAGSTVNIKTNGATSWDGASFLYRVRHDYVERKSKLFFRKPLEGY